MEIKIGKNSEYIVLIDDEDYLRVSPYKLYPLKTKNGNVYVTGYGNSERIILHRYIMNVTESSIWVDHKDRNGLNNQKSNLRICNSSDNQKNKLPRGASKYMGVSKHRKTWLARININGIQQHIGKFDTEEEAALAYNKAAIETGNEFYRLNVL